MYPIKSKYEVFLDIIKREIQNNNKISISERHNILCKCNKISNNLDIDVGREMECVTMKALVNYYNSFSSLVSISYIIKSRSLSSSAYNIHNWKYKRSSWHNLWCIIVVTKQLHYVFVKLNVLEANNLTRHI